MDIKRATIKNVREEPHGSCPWHPKQQKQRGTISLGFHSHEHIAITGRRGIIYFLSVYLYVYYAVLCIHLAVSIVCTFKGYIVLI